MTEITPLRSTILHAHIHKYKEVNIDKVVSNFANAKDRHLSFCLQNNSCMATA